MNRQSPSHDKSDLPEDRFEKTVDESAMDLAVRPALPSGVTGTNVYNPYQANTLPSGNDPVKVGTGKIVGVLGSGGMARVYKTWNEKLEIFRAVKILLPSSQKDLVSRFETEAKITAKLHHPNIVEVYNVGEWNGLPFIEMEIIDGITLETMIGTHGKIPDAVVCAISIQVARALSYAHNQDFLIYGKTYNGIIHRDLKPANIMISRQGVIKLMDFGIARPTEAGLHTMEGHIVGTLQYLSPEQLDGKAIDKRSDLYSFGAIIYEMLTGTKTFPQSTITNLMKMKATNDFRKFSRFNFPINPLLAKITEKCLQQDRDNRYGSSTILLKELTKAISSLSSSTPEEVLEQYVEDPDTFHNRKNANPVFKKIGIISLISILFLIIISGGIYYLLQNPPSVGDIPDRQTPVAPSPPVTQPETITPSQTVTRPQPETMQPVVKTPPVVQPLPPNNNIRKPVKPVEKKPAPQTGKPPVSIPSEESSADTKNSPLDALIKKYGLTNPVEIGIEACNKEKFRDAITALIEVAPANPDFSKRNQYLLWAFIELKNYSGAREIASSVLQGDAFILMLFGRMEEAGGNDKKALDYYESALTKPSKMRETNEIRNDALYYAALIYDKHFIQSPSTETRFKAITAWNNVKRVYTTNMDHPRFKVANKKLSEY